MKWIILLILVTFLAGIPPAYSINQTINFIHAPFGNYHINTTSRSNYITFLNISKDIPYNDLVAYWAFDSDEFSRTRVITSYDWSGYSNDGTYNGGVSLNIVDGYYGKGASFSGVGQYISIGDSPTLSMSAAPDQRLTISAWVKMDDATSFRLINKYEGVGANQAEYLFGTNPSDEWQLILFDNSNGNYEAAKTAAVTAYQGTWTHFTATYDGRGGEDAQNGISIFINGAQQAVTSFDAGGYAAMEDLSNELYLGYLAGTYIDGDIDEVMIFKTNLTKEQVLELYTNQSARFHATGSVYYPQKNISLGPNNPSYNLSIIDGAFNKTLGSELYARMGEWDISKGYYDDNSVGYDTEDNSKFEYGLVGYWHADGNARDHSGYGNNGTLTSGSTTNGVGVYNNSFVFDGLDDYINLGDRVSLNFGDGVNDKPLTISAWVKMDDATKFSIITNDVSATKTEYSFHTYTDDKLYMVFYDDASANYIYAGTSSSITGYENIWTHLVGTYDASGTAGGIKLYINGIIQGVATASNAYTAMHDDGGETWIGSIQQSGHNATGQIDEIMIFNRTLGIEEIRGLYAKGRANWTYGDYKILNTTPTAYDVLSEESTNWLPDIRLVAGTNLFYTPLIYGNITFTSLTIPPNQTPESATESAGIGSSGAAGGLSVTPSIGVSKKELESPTMINKIFSKYKSKEDGICDDGENLLLDKDCVIFRGNAIDWEFLQSMWLLRLALIIGAILYLRRSNHFPLVVLLIIALLFLDGIFAYPPVQGEVNLGLNLSISENKDKSLFLQDFEDLGSVILPNSPIAGGIILIILFWVTFIYLPIKLRNKEDNKRGRTR